MIRRMLLLLALLAGCDTDHALHPRLGDIAQTCSGSESDLQWGWAVWNAEDLAWVEVDAYAEDDLLGTVELHRAPEPDLDWFHEVPTGELGHDCGEGGHWSVFHAETVAGRYLAMWVGAPGTPPDQVPSSFPPDHLRR